VEITLDQALRNGIEAHKLGDVREADRFYTAVLQVQPDHPDANHNMGVLAVGIGKIEDALPFFRAAINSNPSIAQFWLSHIDALMKLNRFREAKAFLEKAKTVEVAHDDFDLLEQKLLERKRQVQPSPEDSFTQAFQLKEGGQYSSAINILEKSIKIFFGDANLLALLAQCYLLQENLSQATKALNEAKALPKSSGFVGWTEARVLLRKRLISDALVVAKDTHRNFPDDVEGMGVLGACYRASGDLDKALELLNRALHSNPSFAEALINRALIHLAREEKVAALTDLEAAYKLKPFITQIWELIIKLKLEAEQFLDALELLIEMLGKDPLDESRLSLISMCIEKLGDPQLAITAFKRVLHIVPDNATIHVNLGIALRKTGEFLKSINHFKRAVSIKADYMEAHYNMGITFKDMNEFQEALSAFNCALAINSNFPDIYNDKGNILKRQRKFQEAIACYKRAIEIRPNYSYAHYNLGITLYEMGDFDGACSAYSKAIESNASFTDAYKSLIELLKTYRPQTAKSHEIFVMDNLIRIKGKELLRDISDEEILSFVSVNLNSLNGGVYNYKTPQSQIYRRNNKDLNCDRHLTLFEERDIIPEFCFGCFKVQIEPNSFIDLIKLAAIFYKLDFDEDLTRKTMVELRPNIPGFYKGLVYCESLAQASDVKDTLDLALREVFDQGVKSKIKRGCSEYSEKFPEYGKITPKALESFKYPKEWKATENEFDWNFEAKPKGSVRPSLSEFCLSDMYIIQKWIDYAKGLGDPTTSTFEDRPIIFQEVYDAAKKRSIIYLDEI
jgi:tetratricopeptide (TPR) repeat protein